MKKPIMVCGYWLIISVVLQAVTGISFGAENRAVGRQGLVQPRNIEPDGPILRLSDEGILRADAVAALFV